MGDVIAQVSQLSNQLGAWFCSFAIAIFVQSSILIAVLFLIDWILHKRVRAIFRYWLWMLVLIKLVLPVALASPAGIGNLIGNHLTNSEDLIS